MPGVPINDGNEVRAPRYLDLRQGKIVGGRSVPYDTPTEILSAVPDAFKAEGLPFYVWGSGGIIETWRLKISGSTWITIKDDSETGTTLVHLGEWNTATAYVKGDVVSYIGSSFMAKLPSTGIIPANGATWGLLAEKGDTGSQGIKGDTGTQGDQGLKGDKGDAGTSVTILGSFNDESELPSTGSVGDGYLIAGDLYVWDGTSWENVGNIKGPKGDKGDKGDAGAGTILRTNTIDNSSQAILNLSDSTEIEFTDEGGGIVKARLVNEYEPAIPSSTPNKYLNGEKAFVIITTDNIPEGTSNKYFNAANADSLFNFTNGLQKNGNNVTALTDNALWNAKKLQGFLISSDPPQHGDLLMFDSTLNTWVMADFPEYANNTAAAADGLGVGKIYKLPYDAGNDVQMLAVVK